MSSPPNFLGFPAEIRRMIYIFADLVRVYPIHFNYKGSRRPYRERCFERLGTYTTDPHDMNFAGSLFCDYRATKFRFHYTDGTPDYEFDYECICPFLPIQLLRVCRFIHDEVFHILYSENIFVLLLGGQVAVSPKAVSKMVSLCVRLNTCACVSNHFCDTPRAKDPVYKRQCCICHRQCRRGSDSPLSEQSITDGGKIRRWQDFCRVLETNLRPPVGLTVIADCANMAMAREVVQLMEHFPMLADCAIRLRQSRSLALQRLAEITVLKLTGRASANPHVPFRFMELPRELRRQILWHTDLVAVCILEWNGKGHGYNYTRQLRPLEEYNNRCCMRCTDAGEACCCIVNHASFSSAQCMCWRFPAALFSVCKELNHDATELFFSANRFMIWEDITLENNHLDRSETLWLLRRMPVRALKYLH